MNNVTVSEIYWEALEVKVPSTLPPFLFSENFTYKFDMCFPVHTSLLEFKQVQLKKIHIPP